MVKDINDYIGKIFTLDFDATLSNNIIRGTLHDSISTFDLIPGTEYIFSLILPITTLTGDLNNEYLIYLEDKNHNDIRINCIFTRDLMETSTVGELCPLQSYDAQTGYRWIFKGRYSEITENGKLVRNIYTSDVTRETSMSMTGTDLYHSIANVNIKPGTTVLCIEDYTQNGFKFMRGHIYLIRGEWGTGELQIDTLDITALTPITVFHSLEEAGYTEPSSEFDPSHFQDYCTNFTFGSTIIGRSIEQHVDNYPKIVNFFATAIPGGINGIDGESSSYSIESLTDISNGGATIFKMYNGNQTDNKTEEYTYIADVNYISKWYMTYPITYPSTEKQVSYFTSNDMNLFLAKATQDDIGKNIVEASTGLVYSLGRVESPSGSGNYNYFWTQKSFYLPQTNSTILGNQASATIAGAGKYIYLGDVGTLTITTNSTVEICILGTLGALNLPSTSKTILLNAMGYTGSELTTADTGALIDGSRVGKYSIRDISIL